MSGPLCSSGKARYASQEVARGALAKTQQHRREHGVTGGKPGPGPAAVYRCKACGGWHLATHARKVGRSVLGNERRGRL
jgi:hypothetical protein